MEMAGIALDKELLRRFLGGVERAPGRPLKNRSMRRLARPSTSTPPSSFRRCCSRPCDLTPPDRGKKTASGHYSTAAGVLDEMSGQHPVVDMILEYRETSKLKSTYVDALPAPDPPGDRARAHLLQPDRCGDRAAVLLQPESAEHPHPHRTGPARPARFCCRPGQCAPLAGLFADRTAHRGAHGR